MKLQRLFKPKEKSPPKGLSPYKRGLYYEDFVCRHLKKRGYRILDRNLRGFRQREIDVVAMEKSTLVFLEIKARREGLVYSPLRSIDQRKREALHAVCDGYLYRLRKRGIDTDDLSIRYDVIALSFDRRGEPTALDHYVSYLVTPDETF
ncbi:MAG: YraN family protein [Clostridia bacterium]|nr:YraN family protein [Clostridia bacterium]